MIGEAFSADNLDAHRLERREKFLRPRNARKGERPPAREWAGEGGDVGAENGLSRRARALGDRLSGRALADEDERVHSLDLASQRRAQRAGGRAEPIAGAIAAIDDEQREIGLEPPAL